MVYAGRDPVTGRKRYVTRTVRAYRKDAGEGDPVPRRRFLRIQADDEMWKAFRLAAVDLDVSSARYLGEIAEAEAHRLGWRAA